MLGFENHQITVNGTEWQPRIATPSTSNSRPKRSPTNAGKSTVDVHAIARS